MIAADATVKTLTAIETLRTELWSCTIGRLAAELDLPRPTMQSRLGVLREQGYVDWNEQPGSLHVTADGLRWVRARRRRTQGTSR